MTDASRHADLAAKAAQRAATPAAVREGDTGFWLELDGKPIKTPAGLELHLPTRALAEAVAAEALLACATGISYMPQQPSALAALRKAVAVQDDMTLTGLAMVVQITGSLVLGLALLEERIDADEAFNLAELNETYQIEKWGEDLEAADRRAARRRDLGDAAAFLRLLRPANT